MKMNDKRLGAYQHTISEPALLKTTVSSRDSSYRKVAKFLLLIGKEEAARIMSRLSPDQREKIVVEIASIRRVERDEASVVLAEFESLVSRAREPSGGVDTARQILETAFGSERAEQMLRKAVPDIDGKPFDYLDGLDARRVHTLIADELPAVKAVVLSQLSPKMAASIINEMETSEKHDTIVRLARLKAINPDVLKRVDDTIREKVLNIGTEDSDSIDGRSALAGILRCMDGVSEKAILEQLARQDPEMGMDIRTRLFTLDDIIHADDRFMQEQLRTMQDRDIALLLAGKPPEFRQKVGTNVSSSRFRLIEDEERNNGPFSRLETEKVTGSFFSIMRRAWENGEFVIHGRDDKGVWV